jgi:excisionase family DNA binding protein
MRRIQPPPEIDRLLTPAEAAAELGVGVRALSVWESAGKIPAVKTPGGHRRYRPADVARLKRKRERARARKAKTA